eukprot:3309151-Pyramimonas_sp.AAC.1
MGEQAATEDQLSETMASRFMNVVDPSACRISHIAELLKDGAVQGMLQAFVAGHLGRPVVRTKEYMKFKMSVWDALEDSGCRPSTRPSDLLLFIEGGLCVVFGKDYSDFLHHVSRLCIDLELGPGSLWCVSAFECLKNSGDNDTLK